jgi:hypothetical protein
MAVKLSLGLRNALLNNGGIKENLDGGFLFVFAGPVPADADAALDMSTSHTQIAKISVSDDGSTGLTFAAPSNGVLNKTSSEAWQGTITFDGTDSGSSSLAPTFFRFCGTSDTGRGAGGTSAKRIQGTAGGPSSAADLDCGADSVVDNGTNKIEVNTGRFVLPAG